MSDYRRTTQTCTIESMDADLSKAIRDHLDRYNLGKVLSGDLTCIQSVSVLPKQGLFGKEKQIVTGVVLGNGWLVWANKGTDVKPHAISARLEQVTVQDYAQTTSAKLIPDSGIVVNGLTTDTTDPGSIFIGLEDNAAGHAFKEEVLKIER